MKYENREDYFQHLAAEYGADIETVKAFASVLGESEDFDVLVARLITALEDKYGALPFC